MIPASCSRSGSSSTFSSWYCPTSLLIGARDARRTELRTKPALRDERPGTRERASILILAIFPNSLVSPSPLCVRVLNQDFTMCWVGYVTFGKLEGSAGAAGSGFGGAASATSGGAAGGDFVPTRRVREAPGGKSNISFVDESEDALAAAPPPPVKVRTTPVSRISVLMILIKDRQEQRVGRFAR